LLLVDPTLLFVEYPANGVGGAFRSRSDIAPVTGIVVARMREAAFALGAAPEDAFVGDSAADV